MSETYAKILIAVVSGGLALIGTLLVARSNAQLKIREVVLTYEQKLQDSYLKNARKYTGSVYVPLSVAVESLRSSYESYRSAVRSSAKPPEPTVTAEMDGAAGTYLTTVEQLMQRGASAYLTSALEERLRSFGAFLERSRGAQKPERAALVTTLALIPRDLLSVVSPQGMVAGLLSPLGFYIMMMRVFQFFVRSKQLLAAPMESKDFEKRFLSDVETMKSLVKEVTLGNQP